MITQRTMIFKWESTRERVTAMVEWCIYSIDDAKYILPSNES